MALGGLIVLSVISAVVLGIIADQTQVSSIWAIIVIESVVALVTLLLTATQKRFSSLYQTVCRNNGSGKDLKNVT